MARDYIYIGSTPCDEPCEQAGGSDRRMHNECAAYIQQLRRVYGQEPEGAKLSTKTEHHDFGSYKEVVCYYDTENEAAREYAFRTESGATSWDEEARQFLRECGLGDDD